MQLNSGKVGAVGELIAAADLLNRGFDVYRAVSQSSGCDLIAVRGTQCLRIEVRVGQILRNGKVEYRKRDSEAHKLDHYAVVLPGGVSYYPILPV